jgi:hypothetical protein
MRSKLFLGNMLIVSLLLFGCGQSESTSSSNADNANKAMSNSSNSATTPTPSGVATPSSNANATRPNQELVPPPEKLPRHDELGNDAQKANDNDRPAPPTAANNNAQRRPRIEERKPPQREKP